MSVTVVDKIVGNLIECAHGDGVSTVFMPDIIAPLPTNNTTYYRTDWQGTYALSPNPRTNLWLQSGALGTAPNTPIGITATSSSVVSPSGLLNAFDLIENGANATHSLRQTLTLAAGPNTQTFCVKPKGRSWVYYQSAIGPFCYVNISSGVVGQTNLMSCVITPQPNGWFKLAFTWASTGGAGILGELGMCLVDGGGAYQGDSASGISCCFPQIEAGSVSTPYILTAASPVTVTDYAINGSGLVTLANTTNPVIGQNIGTGTGSTAAFTITTPNSATPTVTGVWRTDWQGRQRMYSTARTNLALQSNALESVAEWGGLSGLSFTSTTITAPDGSSTAREITTSSVAVSRSQLVTVTPLTNYVHSFWVKRGTIGDLKYSVYDSTGAANIIPPTSFYSQTSTSQWVKISIPFTTPVGCVAVRIYILRNDVGSVGTFYSWGHQLEGGSTATSTITTTTSTVTVTDYSVSSFTVTFATNPLAGAVIEADYTYQGGLGVGNQLSRKLFNEYGVIL